MSIKITEQAKQKSETIINAVNYMKQQAGDVFQNSITPMGERLFDVLVMGGFQTGKSTLISALAGIKMMTAWAYWPAAITTVEYGRDTDNVKVVYDDSPEPKTIPLRRFMEEFTLSQNDSSDDFYERVANISYIEMRSTDEIFADGVRLIESPYIGEYPSRDKAISELVSNANAVIFILSALHRLSFEERDYIAENFAGKNMHNVFFVVNKMDLLASREDFDCITLHVRKDLKDVFTDSNGIFDEKLYSKRVFFIDSYAALCARTGKPRVIRFGGEEVAIPICLEDTGILELETALNEFLNSDERLDAIGQAVLKSMAHCYRSQRQMTKKT